MTIITTDAELDEIYGAPVQRSVTKELDHISEHYRAYIEAAPFAVIASAGEAGLDCTPRGDPAGFVAVIDRTTLHLPDRRGNNRIDTLRNLVRDPRVSLLFLIPGIDVTMRVNGRAAISVDPDLCARYVLQGKAPRTVIIVTVESAYFQCPKALVRAKLWSPDHHVDRASLPTTGQMLAAVERDGAFAGAAYDENYPAHMERTIS